MAYEISEGAAAGAMWIPDNKLSSLTLNNDFEIWEAMVSIYNNLQDPKRVVGGGAEKAAYMAWMDPSDTSPIMMTPDRKIVRNPKPVPAKLNGKTWDARVTAVIHGYSSALAAKAWMRKHKKPAEAINLSSSDTVYLTGGQWDNKIKWLQVTVGGWKDYNSSDLVIVRGKCYYGISLKKKDKPGSVDPPMINKSVMELLKEIGDKGDTGTAGTDVKGMMEDLKNTKATFFGEIILEAMANGGPLGGSNLTDAAQAFYTQIKHPTPGKTPAWTSVIDLKGPAKIEFPSAVGAIETKDKASDDDIAVRRYYIKEVNGQGNIVLSGTPLSATDNKKLLKEEPIQKLFGLKPFDSESAWDMRKFVNGKLGVQNNFYDIIEKVLSGDDLPRFVGSALVSSVLKIELNEQIALNKVAQVDKNSTVKACANCHFGFALITAVGKYDKKMIGSITHGNVKEHPTIQGYLSKISPALTGPSKDEWEITRGQHSPGVDLAVWKRDRAAEKGNEAPAKLFYTIGIQPKTGQFVSVLDLEVRYKGTFSPYPQFIGGMSKEFIKALGTFGTGSSNNKLQRCGS